MTKRRRRPTSSAARVARQDLGLVAGDWELPDLWADVTDLSWDPADLDFDFDVLALEVPDLDLGEIPSWGLGPWEL